MKVGVVTTKLSIFAAILLRLQRVVLAGQFELFDDVADLLVFEQIRFVVNIVIADNQEGRSLEQHHLITPGHLTETLKCLLDESSVRYEQLYDLRPCLIQSLIPYTRPKELLNFHILLLRLIRNQLLLRIVLRLLLSLLNLIHLMYEHKHSRRRTVGFEQGQSLLEVGEVVVDLALVVDVEYIDEDLDILEDGLFVGGEVLTHEVLLAAAVPEV